VPSVKPATLVQLGKPKLTNNGLTPSVFPHANQPVNVSCQESRYDFFGSFFVLAPFVLALGIRLGNVANQPVNASCQESRDDVFGSAPGLA